MFCQNSLYAQTNMSQQRFNVRFGLNPSQFQERLTIDLFAILIDQ